MPFDQIQFGLANILGFAAQLKELCHNFSIHFSIQLHRIHLNYPFYNLCSQV